MSGTQYVRKLATAAAVSLALASSGAFGLGLGEIEMQSALNQPMDAEIRLTAVKPGELDGMIVQLASPEAFARAGIERSRSLSGLNFTVDQSSDTPVIRISSERPVVEPFLNFLLEVDWPQGRMVREYTVLLDPPVFMSPSASERNTGADQPAIAQSGDSSSIAPTPIERSDLAAASEGLEASLLGSESSGAVDNDGGELISLTDLNAPNTDAIAERGELAANTFTFDDIQVGPEGGVEEVTDNVIFDADGQPVVVSTPGDEGSTVVSLDDLLEEDVAVSLDDLEEPSIDIDDVIVSLDDIDSPSVDVDDVTVSLDDIEETASAADLVVLDAPAEVTVGPGDTLFELARDNAPAGVSVQQMMMAMLAVNETSFIDNNVNLVRAGAILRLPDADQANSLTQDQALAAISDQNQLWQDYRDSLRATASTQLAQVEPDTTAEDIEAPIETAALDTEAATDSDSTLARLSDEAQAILDSARGEVQSSVLDNEELKIVADEAATDTAASATADETEGSDAQRIGEINLELRLTREELAAVRLQSTDLTDQVSELQDTENNLDAMVSLQQNEVARLETQLADARDAATEAEAAAASAAEQAAADAEQAATEVADAGTNALTAAGETLEQVELFSPEGEEMTSGADNAMATGADTEIEPVADATQPEKSWIQGFLDDPRRMAIAGVGALGLVGVLGTLLFRRKRKGPEESRFDSIDKDDFDNQAADVAKSATSGAASRLDDVDAFAAAGAAGVAGAAGAATMATSNALASDERIDTSDVNDELDQTIALGSSDAMDELGGLDGDVDLEKDDTLAEVDVYLAYGLHGQAEELLGKAMEGNPDNPVYTSKLLETYHAQSNASGFHEHAADFHQRFGSNNEQWPAIAKMGNELMPGEALFAGAPQSAAPDVSSPTDAESDFMDSSMDPAFAFDEGDLEATGDFSSIADELASESADAGLDFPGFDESGTAANQALKSAMSGTSTDGIDGLGDSVEDLTLDLDQLSGDLELDSAELLESDLSDLDIPELGDDNDLLKNSAAGADGDDVNEVETMMDLAKAYIDLGEKDAASKHLDEIVKTGNAEQVSEAENLLRQIS